MKHGFLTFLANLMHIFLYKGELSVYVRGHRKVTGIRYGIETLFHYSRQVREVIYI